jgi:hypothetical protein
VSFAEQWMEPWDDYEVATERFEEAGDTVVWTTRQTGRRRDSGKDFEVHMVAVCSFRRGRVAQIQWFWDRADASPRSGRIPDGGFLRPQSPGARPGVQTATGVPILDVRRSGRDGDRATIVGGAA